MKGYKTVLMVFAIAYITLIHSAFAQQVGDPPRANANNTQSDRDQDTAAEVRDTDQDIAAAQAVSNQAVSNALLEAQIKQNNETLAMMNARNQFWLQVLQTIMPIVSAFGIALVGWLQVKAARERHAMAASINGMKTELVAVTRSAAFHEGAMIEAEKRAGGEPSLTLTRGLELSDAAMAASTEAHRLAAIAAGEKMPKGAGSVPVEVETISLKPGETASAEATKGGGTSVTKDA